MRGKGRPFQKGQTPGPGAPRIPEEIKQARKIGKAILEGLIHKYLNATDEDISRTVKDKTIPMIDKLICQIIAKSMTDGDYRNFDFLLSRIIGKVKDVVEHQLPKATIVEYPDGSKTELGAKFQGVENDDGTT